jgi:hypothetical protein
MTLTQDLRTATTHQMTVDFEFREDVTSLTDTTHLLRPDGKGGTACGQHPDVQPDGTGIRIDSSPVGPWGSVLSAPRSPPR